ncbi:MAG: ATP-dependent RNA helicase RhlE [Saprospiraceae bacterium]|jgi:ATP-dependent RNA helicase RhlE
MPFSKTGLSEILLKALKSEGYEKPYPIQLQAMPAILKGKDLLGIAQTGSGKTLAFALPVLMNLGSPSKDKTRELDALVLVPTRELAVQVEEVFKTFNRALKNPFVVKAVFGGVSINPQMKSLYGVNILIATPGRLLDLHNSKALGLGKVKMLIIDEADKMLSLGFKDEMDEILKLLPVKRQNALFSATLSDDVKSIHQVVLNKPIIVKIKPRDENLDLINQNAYWVEDEKKGPLLRYLIKKNDMQQVLVFTSSSFKADSVVKKLVKNGIDAMAIHGKKSQGARTDALVKFKNKKLRVLVATDLLSRGIDIEFLPFVINYELPRSPKDYIHRIGRTGRAESPGEAITFVNEEEEHHFKVIQNKMGKQIEAADAHLMDLTI